MRPLLRLFTWQSTEPAPKPTPVPIIDPKPEPDAILSAQGCGVHPKKQDNHQHMIHADDGLDADAKVWCDCCGAKPVAIAPMFNRLRHTCRLCETCLSLMLASLDNIYEQQKRIEARSPYGRYHP